MNRISINEAKLSMWCIVSLFVSRILVAIGFPSIINFLHFVFFLFLIIFLVSHTRKIKKNNLNIAIVVVAICIFISAIVNFVKPVNTILMLLIILEPFVIIAITRKWDINTYVKVENILVILSFLNLLISYFQYFVLGYVDDAVTGIFIGMGSGAHINGAFSMAIGTYIMYCACQKKLKKSIISGTVVTILHYAVIIMCDNKQSILGYGMGLVVVILLSAKNVKNFFKTLLCLVVAIVGVYILSTTVLWKMTNWLSNPENMMLGIDMKFSFIESLKSFRENGLQVLFGFGPGMTLSRVARLLPEYGGLSAFGVTDSSVIEFFKNVYADSWIMQSSSIWTFYFSYASFYGDLGVVGLVAIVSMYIVFYKSFCHKLLPKFLWATILAHGVIFDWLEEPAFVLCYLLIIILIDAEIYKSDANGRKIEMIV